ncbi:Glycosyltransferase involved in cell wall bisynthesis [Lachnospiraceae bacterium A10]|nr:Glycosyltransferase involved in cell wall bisynthesis [Lachnospiraceae bacterium A10]
MITISLCMIVKNEEAVLQRCLDSVADLMDEIIIVDTGSTDHTKEIASNYTDKIYDFPWCDDFAAARNAALSHATMDYIYSCDADEVLDEENRERFKQLKEVLLPEIDIVQMQYLEDGIQTVLNTNRELRPKLFKRLRQFYYVDPIHETLRLDPIVFDSEIEIQHKPVELHSRRDFRIFERAYERDRKFSHNVLSMYIKELYKWGRPDDLEHAAKILEDIEYRGTLPDDLVQESFTILVRNARLHQDLVNMMRYAVRSASIEKMCSELCYEVGAYYYDIEDYPEAIIWLHNVLFETECYIDVNVQGEKTFQMLIHACEEAAKVTIDPPAKAYYERCVLQYSEKLQEYLQK